MGTDSNSTSFPQDGCFYTHVEQRVCEPDEAGRMRCHQVRKILRKCPGYPLEEVESEQLRDSTKASSHKSVDLFATMGEFMNMLEDEARFFEASSPFHHEGRHQGGQESHSWSPFNLLGRQRFRSSDASDSHRSSDKSDPQQWRTYSEYQSQAHEI